MQMDLLGATKDMRKWSPQARPHRVTGTPTSRINVGGWERILSGAAALYLMNRARRSSGLKSYLMGAIGLSLLNRGASGHCPMYGRMNLSSTI